MTTYWDASYPPSLFVPPVPPVVPVTSVSAGSPGAFAPGNATIPATLAALRADPVVGNAGTAKPTAAWTAGQYVIVGDASHAYWDGLAWQAGSAPVVEGAAGASTGSKRKESRTRADDAR